MKFQFLNIYVKMKPAKCPDGSALGIFGFWKFIISKINTHDDDDLEVPVSNK